MAKITKKIKRRIAANADIAKQAEAKPKKSRDMLLLILIAVTAMIMFIGYQQMETMAIAMYSAMLATMICLYLSRHSNFSPTVIQGLRYASFGFIALVVVLMIANFALSP